MIDFHAHILPGIDDGAKDIDQSIQILTMLKEQGVNTVIATPHYYDSVTNIKSFIAKRNSVYKELADRINNEKLCLPKIILGAEVYLSPDTIFDKDLNLLCIGETKCILIEMPVGFWFDWMYSSVKKIIDENNLTPVIAHLERYAVRLKDMKRFDRLLEMDVLVQINAGSFSNMNLRKIIKKLFEVNKVHLLGSDTHNITDRRPKIQSARKKIVRKYGIQHWELLHSNANELLSGNVISDYIDTEK